MTRRVELTAKRPIKVEPSDKPIWICACGLSQKFPLCDGHHKQCDAEQDGTLYTYDAEGNNPKPAEG